MPVWNKRDSGIPKGALYIGRPSQWGNPFVIGRDGTRDQVVVKYRQWLWDQVQSGDVAISDLAALNGKDLVCFCAPLKCHGDVLLHAAQWAVRRLGEENP